MALMFGWDPLEVLSLTDADWIIAQAIIKEASEIHHEQETHRMKAMQVAVQNGVARAFKKG